MTKLKVSETIKAAGSITAFAEAIELPRTTVAYWHESNRVPAWRRAAFVAAAEKLGIDPQRPPRSVSRRAA
jgi:phage tail sheath gpL-like